MGTQYSEDAEEIVMPRPRRRMNIDQLRTAFEQVSGGISWTERSGRNEVNLFETLSSTPEELTSLKRRTKVGADHLVSEVPGRRTVSD